MTVADAISLCAVVFLLVCLAGLGMGAWFRRTELRERELELGAAQSAERAARHIAVAERLEQRVRVLERIAIDAASAGNPVLANEIESLRQQAG
ncbi:MAG: hypothetical protein RIS94_1931 [Pseudomonadota bacterium]|jgi:hypothetical protein